MTHRTIWHSRRAVDNRGKLHSMTAVDADAWKRTRELHPEYYRKVNGNG